MIRCAWVPQATVLLILLGAAGPHFDNTSPSLSSGKTLLGNRLSFFSLCLSSSVTYSSCAADYFVYCSPKLVTRTKVFFGTMCGLTSSFALCFVIGCGLSSGLHNNPTWAAAGSGSGALVVAGFDGLGAFGKVCAVITALGLVSNMVPPIYCCGVIFQVLGRYPAMVPRFIWNALAVVIFTVCALAGKNDLSLIFMNFLALMGYWVILWVAISLEEQLVFRRNRSPKYVWSDWNRQDKLPVGVAALMAFCLGWVAAILSMRQVYYTGPLAKLVGDEGADLGSFIGFAVTALSYFPARKLELAMFKR
ncbi:hypothetical protein BJ878DRAFT_511448 [Calycina marina]|uniref:Purine-cytosine permease n=1 Tax=Calycina marina TaxID=1763456 RepID=A0A9P8CE13_9HELO|nr:hypothetical protein BJ878DRAFT_511448 [Calycina marina]